MRLIPSDSARVSVLLDYVVKELSEAGDTVSYGQILDLCEIPASAVKGNVSTITAGLVHPVNTRLHRMGDWRWLINVPNIGYRVGSPSEVRLETIARNRHAIRQMEHALRSTVSVTRHPDASVADRKRAIDAAAAQGTMLQMVKREQRKRNRLWPADERSPVTVDSDTDDS